MDTMTVEFDKRVLKIGDASVELTPRAIGWLRSVCDAIEEDNAS